MRILVPVAARSGDVPSGPSAGVTSSLSMKVEEVTS